VDSAEPLAQLGHVGFRVEQEVCIGLSQQVAREMKVQEIAADEVVANVVEPVERAIVERGKRSAQDRGGTAILAAGARSGDRSRSGSECASDNTDRTGQQESGVVWTNSVRTSTGHPARWMSPV
jgi:hypothetical protein